MVKPRLLGFVVLVTLVAALLMISGCATILAKSWSAPTVDADRDQCRAEAQDAAWGTAHKALVWASNIVWVPVTMPLILVGGPYYFHPPTDDQARAIAYDRCMMKLGYNVK